MISSGELPKCNSSETKDSLFSIIASDLSRLANNSENDIKAVYSLDFSSIKQLSFNDKEGQERRTCTADVSLVNRATAKKERANLRYSIIFGKDKSMFYVHLDEDPFFQSIINQFWQ